MVQAWRAHTNVPAEVMGETRLGRVEAGMRADLVVVGPDPFASGAMIRELTVEATMVDGWVRFDGQGRFG